MKNTLLLTMLFFIITNIANADVLPEPKYDCSSAKNESEMYNCIKSNLKKADDELNKL